MCAAVTQTAPSLDRMQSYGRLKDAFFYLKGTQPPTGWDPRGLDRNSAEAQLLQGRFFFMEDCQAGHNDMEKCFPKAKVIINCNETPANSVQREENGIYTCQDTRLDYKKLDEEYEAVVFDVFDTEARTKMFSHIVPRVQQTLMQGNDVIFHDKKGECLCVIAGAAMQRALTGHDMNVSDCKFYWIDLSAPSQN